MNSTNTKKKSIIEENDHFDVARDILNYYNHCGNRWSKKMIVSMFVECQTPSFQHNASNSIYENIDLIAL